jgi:chromosome partitioning protein
MVNNVVSFINMKGGVGKTTLAVNIGYTLSKEFGRKVLLIDVDPQMNSTQYTLNSNQVKDIMENPRKTLYGILYEMDLPAVTSAKPSGKVEPNTILPITNNFDIIPSHLGIMNLDLDKHPYKLKQYIKDNRGFLFTYVCEAVSGGWLKFRPDGVQFP